jgi:GH25 family lysozyme M1 (1,4-beta-N-acetylmuramidase)
MSYIQGVDVSHVNPCVDWHKLRNQDIRFAFIKSTDGISPGLVNPYFDEQWAGAKSAGILRGSYHYLKAAIDGVEQAEFFLSKVNVQDGDLPPVLDIEAGFNDNASTPQFIDNSQKWLERVESKSGRRPIVYASTSFLNPWGSVQWAKNYQTWIAEWHYTDQGAPTQPTHWGDWIFWQYSDQGNLDGIYDDKAGTVPKGVDRSIYRYSLEDLYKLAKASLSANDSITSHQSVQTTSFTAPKLYTVKAGDTLNSIAIENGTTQKEIAALNNLAKATDISVGKVLKLPSSAQTQTNTSMPQKTYTVKAGDTLNSIAIENGTTQKEIAALNNLVKATDISVGKVLKLP